MRKAQIFGIILSLFLLTPVFLRILGYHIDEPGWKVGQIAAERNDVSICSKIIMTPLMILAPGTQDQRQSCIYTYAELKKDPSACELLGASPYLLSCLGAAQNPGVCHFYEKFTVSWSEEDVGHKATLLECQDSDPARSKKGDQCCHVASVTYLKDVNDCSKLIDNTEIYDECLYRASFKNKDPAICANIKNTNLRTICIIGSTAIKENPYVCHFCDPPLNSISDLKIPIK